MEQDKFMDIDDLLSRRATPPHARADLAENIIHAAVSMPRQDMGASPNWFANLQNLFSFSWPRAALAMGVVLCLVIVGQLNVNHSNVMVADAPSATQYTEISVMEDDEWAMLFDAYDEGFSL